MPLTKTQFAAGMTVQQYIDQIKVNKDPFVEIYNAMKVPGEATGMFDGLPAAVNLAVFTADWCGDAVSTTPVILRLAESSPKISVQVFNRDDDVPLANTFLPEHRAGTVPIFVVFDGEMNEVARFIETAYGLVPQIDAMDDSASREAAGPRRGRRPADHAGAAHRPPGVPRPRLGRGHREGVLRRRHRRIRHAPAGAAGGGRHQVAAGRLSLPGLCRWSDWSGPACCQALAA